MRGAARTARSHGTLKGVSLFTNCGAGDFGFAAAGFQFEVMAELIESRLDVALLNHPRAEGVPGDLRDTWPSVVEGWRRRYRRRRPDLVAACPPCQGMSTARSGRGPERDPEAGSRDERNLLVLPIAEVAKALKPKFVVVENVPAFLRRRVRDPESGAAVSAACLLIRLLSKNYHVYPLLTDLADYGVPQTRKRAFLTFVRRRTIPARFLKESGSSPYPAPTHVGELKVSLKEALADFDLPALDAAAAETSGEPDRLHFIPVWPERQYDMVAAIPPGSGASAWENDLCPDCGDVDVGPDAAVCPTCQTPLLRPVVIEEGSARLVNGFRRSSYRRMDPEAPAATITTASGRVGSSRTIHPTENRVLSPRECALLQTIPFDFDWSSALEDRGVMELRSMIGEAVPPRFTEMHGRILAGLARRQDAVCLSEDDQRCRAARGKLECVTK